jgi:hypothetical protein
MKMHMIYLLSDLDHDLPITDQTHQHRCEEGTTMPLPPQEAESIWHGPSDPQKVPKLPH